MEGTMSKWEYKSVPLERSGTKEDFGFNWIYGPWQMTMDNAGKQLLAAGLKELGSQGWELAGVIPCDLWAEGSRAANSSSGIRAISCTLLFKRPLGDGA
jgi:hypothetical protein